MIRHLYSGEDHPERLKGRQVFDHLYDSGQ